MDQFSASLFLWWRNGEVVQATPGMQTGQYYYASATARIWRGSKVSRRPAARWYPYVANWVKIALLPKTIVFYGSADGKRWNEDWEIPRGERLAGAPQWLILGRGSVGEKPLLCNPHPKHFNPNGAHQMFFSDLIVAKTPGPAQTGKQAP